MKLSNLIAATAIVLGLAAPATAQEVKFINLATATSGGTFYPAGIALTKLLSDKTDMRASAISSAGSVENVSLLRNEEVNMAFVQIDVAQNAIAGKGPFEGDGFEGMAMLSPLFSSADHILVANDSGIESLADLKGKRVAAGRPGSGTLLSTQAVLASQGLTLEDINVEYLGQSEAIAALQNEYSLFTRDPEKKILPLCEELGIALVPYSPLGRGQLTGGLTSPDQLSEGDFRKNLPRFQADAMAANAALVETLKSLAEARGVTAAQLALAWLLSRKDFVVPIPGARKIKHLEENAAAADIALTSAEQAEIGEKLANVAGARYRPDQMAMTGR